MSFCSAFFKIKKFRSKFNRINFGCFLPFASPSRYNFVMSRLDKYRKAHGGRHGSDKIDLRALERRHRHIAVEAARRLPSIVGSTPSGELARSPGQADYYAAKMQSVAVLGLTIKPGDLPPDSLVWECYEIQLHESQAASSLPSAEPADSPFESPAAESEEPAQSYLQDRFEYYLSILLPLETVKQNPKTHPEGDALFHSLQVFENAWQANPYDEELLTAALLHDVGKGLQPHGDHHSETLRLLQGRVTARTLELIERMQQGLAYHAGTLGHRARKALLNDPDHDAIMILADADLAGRRPGAPVPSLQEALDRIRDLAEEENT